PYRSNEGVGILSLGQLQYLNAEVLIEEEIQRPLGRRNPGGVRIVTHHHLASVAAQQLHLLCCQTRPQRGDDVVNAKLVRDQKIHVPLDQDGEIRTLDSFTGEAKPEQVSAFIIKPGLRRIQILRLSFPHRPSAKSDNSSAGICDRKHDPAPKSIVLPAPVLGTLDQPAVLERLGRVSFLAQPLQPNIASSRGIAQLEEPYALARNAPPLQVSPRPFAFGRIHSDMMLTRDTIGSG